MPKKSEKPQALGENGYKLILTKVAASLKQAERNLAADSIELLDLSYSMEKLAREVLADSNQQRATAYFTAAVERLRQVAQLRGDRGQELAFYYSAGQTYAGLGVVEEALKNFAQALKLSEALNDRHSQALALRQLGNLKLRRSQWQEAIACFEQSYKICQDISESRDEAYALNSLAAAYFHTAAWRKMEATCQRAEALAENIRDDELTACIHNNLAALYNLQGQGEKALAALQISVALFEKLGDLRGLAEACNNLGTTYRDKEFWQESGKYYAKALQLARQVGDAVVEAQVTINRVELYLLMYDLEMAESQCQTALHMFHGIGHKSGEADACRLLGVTYTRQENWHLAQKYLDEALALNQQFNQRLGLAETHKSYAEFWQAQGKVKSAVRHWQKSLLHYQALKAHREIRNLRKRIAQAR
ncbi:tetratricopeptide repeat protein [candidate division KSB1 bacterium]|nr:tetratricopeptide repeat protein [candidate division KSB1 bacterium]